MAQPLITWTDKVTGDQVTAPDIALIKSVANAHAAAIDNVETDIATLTPSNVAYGATIPFTNACTILAAHTVAANTTLTPRTVDAVAGFGASMLLTANSSYTVNLSGFKLIGTGTWDNTTGVQNLLLFYYDEVNYNVCISQPTAIAAPGGAITLNAPTSFAAGTPTVDGCPFTFDDTNTSPAEDSGLIEIAEVADTTYSAVVGTRTPGANATSALPGSDLTAGTDYRARMKFVGNGTTTLDSPWSAEVTFTTAASDVVAPTVTFEATSATNIRGTFSEAMGTVTVAGWDFDNGSPITPSAVALVSGNDYDFTVAGLASTDTITASYNTTTGATTDVAGNEVATITAQSVTNSVPGGGLADLVYDGTLTNFSQTASAPPDNVWSAAGGLGHGDATLVNDGTVACVLEIEFAGGEMQLGPYTAGAFIHSLYASGVGATKELYLFQSSIMQSGPHETLSNGDILRYTRDNAGNATAQVNSGTIRPFSTVTAIPVVPGVSVESGHDVLNPKQSGFS